MSGIRVRLTVTKGPAAGTSFAFDARDRFVVGRARDAHLSIRQDRFFSRHHLLVEVNPPNVFLRDLGSMNGTFVNGGKERVREALLRHGDRIEAGETVLSVSVEDEAEACATMTMAERRRFFADLLPGDDGQPLPGRGRRLVRCARCGTRAADEPPRRGAEDVTFYCEPCRGAILADPPPLPGLTLVKELGRGDMGSVHLARHEATGERRAVKFVVPRAPFHKETRRRFLSEVRARTQVRHPGLVPVLGLAETGPAVFSLSMDHVDAPSAADLLARAGGPLPVPLAGAILEQLLDTLTFVHARGLVHCDLKDTNVLVCDLGGRIAVRVTDLGLATEYLVSGASGFARVGERRGSLAFVSPEQILNFRAASPSTDVYAAGAVLYRLLSGRSPIPPGSAVDDLLAVLETPPSPLLDVAPHVPIAVAAVAERALAKEPSERFSSAREMRDALGRAMGGAA